MKRRRAADTHVGDDGEVQCAVCSELRRSLRKARVRDDNIIAEIEAFDRRCEDEEYTDTDDAWTLFHHIRDMLKSWQPICLDEED